MGAGAGDRPSFMEEPVMVFEISVDDGKYVSLLLLFVALSGLTDILLHCCQFKGSLYGCL